MEGRTLLVFEFSGKNVPQLSTKPQIKASPFERKADYLPSTSILGFNMFLFSGASCIFSPDMIYIYMHILYIDTYIHICTFFSLDFFEGFQNSDPKKKHWFHKMGPYQLYIEPSKNPTRYLINDVYFSLKFHPKKTQVEFFFRPPTKRTGFAGRLKSERFVPTPGFHASFGSVVWGGGKFGGGRGSPNRGTSMAQEVTLARATSRTNRKKRSNKTMWQPFQIYCLKTKGHRIF